LPRTRDHIGKGLHFRNDRSWRILLQKSFWGAERKFLEPLMRLAPRDVRDLIVSEKNDHGPSYWRYGALQRWSCLKYYFREILGVVRFSTFATKSALNGNAAAVASCLLLGEERT
jgi:hypothetical protein